MKEIQKSSYQGLIQGDTKWCALCCILAIAVNEKKIAPIGCELQVNDAIVQRAFRSIKKVPNKRETFGGSSQINLIANEFLGKSVSKFSVDCIDDLISRKNKNYVLLSFSKPGDKSGHLCLCTEIETRNVRGAQVSWYNPAASPQIQSKTGISIALIKNPKKN